MSRLSNLPPGVTDAMIEEAQAPAFDFRVDNHGSVCIVTPLSEECKEWVGENVPLVGWQWFGSGFAVEPRYLARLVEGMRAEGLHQEESV